MTAEDANRLDRRVKDEVHDCAVPICGERARTAFLAAGDGYLAGVWWRQGDFLDFCWPHADLVYRGLDPLSGQETRPQGLLP